LNYLALIAIIVLLVAATASFIYGLAFIKTLHTKPRIYISSDAYTGNGLRVIAVTLYGNYDCVNMTPALLVDKVSIGSQTTYFVIVNVTASEETILVCNNTYIVRV